MQRLQLRQTANGIVAGARALPLAPKWGEEMYCQVCAQGAQRVENATALRSYEHISSYGGQWADRRAVGTQRRRSHGIGCGAAATDGGSSQKSRA